MVQAGISWYGGGIHGLAQVAEKFTVSQKKHGRFVNAIKVFLVFVFCNLAWVLFRAESIGDAAYIFTHFLKGIQTPGYYFTNHLGMENIELLLVAVTILILAVYDYFSMKYDVIEKISERPVIIRCMVYVILIFIILVRMPSTSGTEFIYFQF